MKPISYSTDIIIGIDPGKDTGFAARQGEPFIALLKVKIHEAMWLVKELAKNNPQFAIKPYIEDARLNRIYGNQVNAKKAAAMAQGVGSVKREAGIWNDYLLDLQKKYPNIKYNETHLLAAIKGKKQRMLKPTLKEFNDKVRGNYTHVFSNLPNVDFKPKRKDILGHHTFDAGIIANSFQ